MKRIAICAFAGVLLISCHNQNGAKDVALQPVEELQENERTDQEVSSSSLKLQPSPDSSETQAHQPFQPPVPVVKNQTMVTTPAQAAADYSRKLIKHADVKVEVESAIKYSKFLNPTLKKYGAFIAGEKSNYQNGTTENNLTIKVPVIYFEDLLNDLNSDNSKLIERNISTEDVTGAIGDTKARIEAKKIARSKYLEMMKQSKNVEEMLQVQSEVNTIQEEIEGAAGRVAALSQQSALSTIELTFYEVGAAAPTDNTATFFEKMGHALQRGATGLGEIVVGIAYVWPLLLLPIGFWMYRRMKNGRKFAVKNR